MPFLPPAVTLLLEVSPLASDALKTYTKRSCSFSPQAAIRKELNEFKSTEMEVHASSKHLTRSVFYGACLCLCLIMHGVCVLFWAAVF